MAAKLTIQIEIDDRGSIKVLNKTAAALDKVDKEAKGASRAMDRVEKSSGKVSKGAKIATGGLLKMGLALGGAAGIIRLLRGAVGASIDLEKGLREVGTLMGGLADDEIKAMGDELKALSVSSGQALDRLVQAEYDIISAGFANAADAAIVLAAATDLAVAGVSDVGTAADLVTTVMKAFNFEVSETVAITDKLQATVIAGKTTIDEMGGSLGRVLGIFGSLNVDIDEVLGTFATLATVMGSSERAVTALGGSMAALLTPSAGLVTVMESLGVETALTLVEQVGFANAIRMITDEARRLNIPITDVIKGQEALSGILPLTGTAAELLAKNIASIGDAAGTVQLGVEEMGKSTAFQVDRMRAAFTVLGAEMADPLLPILAAVAEAMANIVRPESIFQDVFDLEDTPAKLAAMTETLAIFQARAENVRGSILEFSNTLEIEALTAAIRKTARALSAVIVETNVFGLAIDELAEDINLSLIPTFDELADAALDTFEEIKEGSRALADQMKVDFDSVLQKWLDDNAQRIQLFQESASAISSIGAELTERKLNDINFTSRADTDATNAKAKTDIDAINTRATAEIRAAKNTIRDETLLAAKIREIEAKKAADITAIEAERATDTAAIRSAADDRLSKARQAQKPFLIATAIANTAVGATKAFAQGGVLGFITGALVTVAGLAQVATIRAQKFALGGSFIVPGSGGTDSQLIPIQATPGERITVETPEQQAAGGGGDTFIFDMRDSIIGAGAIEEIDQRLAELRDIDRSEAFKVL